MVNNVSQSAAQPPASQCLRCGRSLTATASVRTGYGPGCRARIRAAAIDEALAAFTAAQRDKAAELIADGGLVPMSRASVWRAVGSDGSSLYLVSPRGCNCPAGLRGRPCYHQAAARVLASTRKAA